MKRFDIGFGLQCGFTVLLILAIVAVFAVAIVSDIQNENNRIDAGVIVDRYFESGYQYAHADKNGGRYSNYPDTYYFVIEGEKDGETVRYCFEVTAQEYEKYRIGDFLREVKEMQNDNVKKLFDLIAQNPGLPVIPMVDSEICCDNCYGRYMGEIGSSFVGEYAIYDDTVIYDREEYIERCYDNDAECLCERFRYNPRINYHAFERGECTESELAANNEAEKLLNHFLESVAEKEFQKAILVNIEIPS